MHTRTQRARMHCVTCTEAAVESGRQRHRQFSESSAASGLCHIRARAAAWPAVALLATGWASSVWAIDRSLCDDDGVTETPAWATRDASQCLILPTGNGSADVPFQYETFHKRGTATCGRNEGLDDIDLKITNDGCPTKNSEGCALLIWDTVIDNYLSPQCKNNDILFIGYGHQYIYFKDSIIANGWACKGGTGWDGPNGTGCAPGEDSAAHSDGLQGRGIPNYGGWLIFQDSTFVNGYNLHMLLQLSPTFGANGSFMIQGGTFGRLQSVGAATTWIDDCKARQQPSSTSDICTVGRTDIGYPMAEVWLIDVWSPAGTTVKASNPAIGKVVVVNTGCSTAGCGGAIGYASGWPHPLGGGGTGPGTCPNGQIDSSPPTYCYTSLENAAVAHTLPPFAQLSIAGWENPPGVGLSAIIGVSPNPVEAGAAFTLTATPTGGAAPYEVTWDCDGDGACDDGSPDSTSPYSQACPGFGASGARTVKVCVADNDAATANRTTTLTVTPDCGNNTLEIPELCDGTALAGQSCVSQGYAAGTLACNAMCSGFVTTGCDGGPTCGDGICSPAEAAHGAGTDGCFEDCAQYSCDLVGLTEDGWDTIVAEVESGDIVDLGATVGGALSMVCDGSFGWENETPGGVSGFRWQGAVNATQSSPIYAMCGDTGVDLSDTLPCEPAIGVGTHTIEVTPCSGDWSSFLDGGCTDAGGKLGPTRTIAFTVVDGPSTPPTDDPPTDDPPADEPSDPGVIVVTADGEEPADDDAGAPEVLVGRSACAGGAPSLFGVLGCLALAGARTRRRCWSGRAI